MAHHWFVCHQSQHLSVLGEPFRFINTTPHHTQVRYNTSMEDKLNYEIEQVMKEMSIDMERIMEVMLEAAAEAKRKAETSLESPKPAVGQQEQDKS